MASMIEVKVTKLKHPHQIYFIVLPIPTNHEVAMKEMSMELDNNYGKTSDLMILLVIRYLYLILVRFFFSAHFD